MDDLSATVGRGLVDYFEMVRLRAHKWVAPITEEQLWERPHPYGNTVGHVLLHVTGNLNYYIGAEIAGSGYVRDRDREFNDPARRPKAEVLAAFDTAFAMVQDTIRKQSPADWAKAYSGKGSEAPDRFSILLNCAAHAHHHVGQLIYLQKAWAAKG
jgi:hypothetical protein